MQKVGATIDWSLNNEEYLAELDNAGLFPLVPRMPSHSAYGLMCSGEARTLDDLAQKRVRVGGKAWSEEAKNLGMVPVDLPASEAFTSFQQGLIDCFMGGATDVASLGLTQLGGTFNQAQLTGYSANGLMMSGATWKRLPPELQEVLWDNLSVFLEEWYTNYRLKNLEFVKSAAANGVVITTPDQEMAKRIDAYHRELITSISGSAPASVSDGVSTVSELEDYYEKWGEKVQQLGFSNEDDSWADFGARVSGQPASIAPLITELKSEVLDTHRPGNG